MTPQDKAAPGLTNRDIEGDKIRDPRSAWERRHNAMCDELLRLRSPPRESQPTEAIDQAIQGRGRE